MKVLQINSVCGVGSTGRIATDIHQILQELGHESYIAYGREEAINCNNKIKIGNKFDNYSHVAKTRILDLHGFGSKKATEKFLEEIEENDPDIIHLHNIHGYYINIELLFEYLKKINKPVIWTLHDCWAFTGHCSYFDFAGCEKWKTHCFDCPEKNAYPSSLYKDNSTDNFSKKKSIFNGVKNLTIVTPSIWLSKLVKQSFLKEYPVEVINNGIDLNIFKQVDTSFKEENKIENKFLILGVASVWDRRKGLNYFIELAKQINEDEVIALIGLTDDQKKILPNNIIGINRTNNINELVQIYAAANVFINPTLEDNFPTTNLEALACGTPVITFNTGGSIESIDSECGIVVEQGDIKGLLTSLNDITAIDSKHCRKKAYDFEKNKQFNKYIELYLSKYNWRESYER